MRMFSVMQGVIELRGVQDDQVTTSLAKKFFAFIYNVFKLAQRHKIYIMSN